jgi:hypothetical protein
MTLTSKIWSFIRNGYVFDKKRISDEEWVFCKSWLDQRDITMTFITATLGAAFHAVSLVVEGMFVKNQDIFEFLTFVHVFMLLTCLFYFRIPKRFETFIRLWAFVGHFVTVLAYAYVLRWAISVDPINSIAHFQGWTAFLTLGIFSTILSPFHNLIAMLYSPVLLMASWYCWSDVEGGAGMLGISIFAFVGVQVFQSDSVMRSFQEARREYANRQKVAAAQKEAYEQQLIIARNIQDSFTPQTQFSKRGLDVCFFQIRSQTVGGDWMAVRTDEDEQTFVVIADAAGKGVQAALVTHAIQAMWADALSSTLFDPVLWLTRVHNTLRRMGEKSTHSATVGVLRVGRDDVEYWSAGHLPAFLFADDEDVGVSALAARGDLLGLGESVNFTSIKQKLPEREFDLLLGTDGVFEKGTSESPRALKRMLEGVRSNPNYLLEQKFTSEDDRTLIWVKVQPEHLK